MLLFVVVDAVGVVVAGCWLCVSVCCCCYVVGLFVLVGVSFCVL